MATYRLAAYGVLIAEGRILLTRLADKEANKGMWTLPGGGLERGESPEEGAVREIHEETGLQATLGRLLYAETKFHRLPDGGEVYQCRFYFAVESWTGETRPEANGWTDAVEWVPIERVADRWIADVVGTGLSAWEI